MVFFSSDRLEIERVSQKLTGAAIPCEVHEGVAVKREVGHFRSTLFLRTRRRVLQAVLSEGNTQAVVAAREFC